MGGLVDDQLILITCDECGHKLQKSVAWVKRHKQLTCTCGVNITLDADSFVRQLDSTINSSLAAFNVKLKKLKK